MPADTPQPEAGAAAGAPRPTGMPIQITAQYVKDLSFENPNSPHSVMPGAPAPQVAVNVEVRTQQLNETLYEVVLTVRGDAKSGDKQAFIVELSYGGLVNLTNGGENYEPAWSPDGTQIAFQSDRDTPFGGFEIYLMNASGSEQRRLTNVPAYDGCPAWITGSRLSFLREQAGATAIFITTADDGFGLTQLTSNPTFDGEPSWSPDGRYIAFRSNRDANAEIYVMQADGTGQVNITHSLAGDSRPAWRP